MIEKVNMERENFSSRLGFILISAGCAIGIGNVWRFPYVAGYYGGGFFVLFYLIFLAVLGIPILTMELAMGRAGKSSIIQVYQKLERPGQKWHIHGFFGMAGNYILLFFYTTVAGWMLGYFIKYALGQMEGITDSAGLFAQVQSDPGTMIIWMFLIVLIAIVVCSLGLQNGVERITKWMMLLLFGLIAILAVHSLTLAGAGEGLRYYLVPDLERMKEVGILNTIIAAMNQSFFTLSIGLGSMMIFGSYIGKEKSLLGESITITALDTFIAIMSGLIIFPACFSFQIPTDSGPSLIFVTLPKVFEHMTGGRIWGMLFFLFMTFAALSTVIAVLENILACNMEWLKIGRKKACVINFFILLAGSLPCIFGFNIWKQIQLCGAGSTILDFEDFLVSNLLLPFGSLVIVIFCTTRYGWGFSHYLEEVNEGRGLKLSGGIRFYLKWILPVIIILIALYGFL